MAPTKSTTSGWAQNIETCKTPDWYTKFTSSTDNNVKRCEKMWKGFNKLKERTLWISVKLTRPTQTWSIKKRRDIWDHWSSAFLPTWTKPIRFCVYPNVPRIAWPYPMISNKIQTHSCLGSKSTQIHHRPRQGATVESSRPDSNVFDILQACTWRIVMDSV